MKVAPIPENEKSRLEVLKSMNILDTPREERFDNITRSASQLLKVPISTISIIDENREWYKSSCGIEGLTEGNRDISFCGHTLANLEDVLVVEDTLNDKRFEDNPYVIGEPYIRFYAGVRLFSQGKKVPIGVFCIKDKKPRKLSVEELALILDLASKAEKELNKNQD